MAYTVGLSQASHDRLKVVSEKTGFSRAELADAALKEFLTPGRSLSMKHKVKKIVVEEIQVQATI